MASPSGGDARQYLQPHDVPAMRVGLADGEAFDEPELEPLARALHSATADHAPGEAAWYRVKKTSIRLVACSPDSGRVRRLTARPMSAPASGHGRRTSPSPSTALPEPAARRTHSACPSAGSGK